ncbi:MAG: DMT family transporter [Acidimicrobiales bacterium]
MTTIANRWRAAATAGRAAAPLERRSLVWPYAALVTVALLWGFGPPISKLITAPPLTVSFVRLWSSAVGMVLVQLVMRNRPSRAAFRGSVAGGLAFGANSLCFFYSLQNASIATITVIMALQPGLVMLAASRLFGERITPRIVGWTAVAIGGAGLAVLGAGAKVHTNALGIASSVGSLLCFSAFFLVSKQARRTLGAGEYIMGAMTWAALLVTPVVALGGGLAHLDSVGRGDLFWVLVMFIGPGVGGQVLIGWTLRWVPVSLSAMVQLGATAISIVAAWPIHSEVPTLAQLLGGAIALASVGAILRSASAD